MERVEESAKRVRAYLGGRLVVDTVRPRLVWEDRPYPVYYLPVDDLLAELDGDAVVVDGVRVPAVVNEELPGLVKLEWSALDSWFEEDEEVFFHPRNPYRRVDVLPSSRHVRVEVDGVTVAESRSPRVLFETRLPARYYLPRTHVRMDLLEPSETVTGCPYKGEAVYWSVRVNGTLHEDLAWGYPTPLPESEGVRGLVTFYNDRVDLFVDGVRVS